MSKEVFDKRELRQALGAFATGVTVVTTADAGGNPVGLTANSFNSVSLDPPLVLWSLALDSLSLDAFRQAGWWAVHILSAAQEDLSNRFAARGADKFSGLEFSEGPGRVPLIDGCAARFVCRTAFEYDGGDHAIFVGEVVEMQRASTAPLIYHGGKYRQVMPDAERPAAIEPGDEGEFSRHFIGHLLSSAHHAVFADVRREYRKRGLRAAEYTVLAALGLGDGCTRDTLLARAAKAGAELPQGPIDAMLGRGLLSIEGETLRLTLDGRRTVMELIAVAQASQLRIQDRFSQQEMAMLLHLLRRMADA